MFLQNYDLNDDTHIIERINGLQVRSRSLTQLDALGSKMLDTGEHHLGGGPSQQQSHHLHHHYQPQQQLQHPQNVESNPRFLAPTAPSVEGSRQNRRHKLSRSQVGGSLRLNICVCVCIRYTARLKVFMQIQPHIWNKKGNKVWNTSF